LWETAATVASTVTPSPVALVAATGGCALLLYGGITIGWGLFLVKGHAELLDTCQLSLHLHYTCSLVLDEFLHGSVRGTKFASGLPYDISDALLSTAATP
jgi:hypothetical protein